jgi:LPPG:FO 2-phospho-L-lactate transferase
VGAARFLQGLAAVHPPSDITVISNVGDDAEFFGLHVSPDIDIVLYHLAGLADEVRGYGLKGDTHQVLQSIGKFGYDTWFQLGDADLATCITRTDLLRKGRTLSEATAEIAAALLAPLKVIPVTDDPLRTKIRTDDGVVDFQEYFVRRRTEGHTWEVICDGADAARPAPGVIEAISTAEAVLLSPSNPLVSIGPLLAVPGVRDELREAAGPVMAVSPIVGGRTIKGPADRMLRDQGMEASALSVAKLYADFLDVLVIDSADEVLLEPIEALGMRAVVVDTIMDSMEKKAGLARAVLEAARP